MARNQRCKCRRLVISFVLVGFCLPNNRLGGYLDFYIAKSLKLSRLVGSFGRCVAQPGSALSWGVRGRRFKSSHTDQLSF